MSLSCWRESLPFSFAKSIAEPIAGPEVHRVRAEGEYDARVRADCMCAYRLCVRARVPASSRRAHRSCGVRRLADTCPRRSPSHQAFGPSGAQDRTDDETPDFQSKAHVVEPPHGAAPKVPEGFAVEIFASGLRQPLNMEIAPNGDIFLAEAALGGFWCSPPQRRRTCRPSQRPSRKNLERPYGIVFQPPADPQNVYVAAVNQVVRSLSHRRHQSEWPGRGGDL